MAQFADPLPGVPAVESPFLEAIFGAKGTSAETLEVARRLRRDGYAVIDFPEPDFDRLAATIIKTLDPKYDWNAWRNGSLPGLRTLNAWSNVPEVKQIACNRALLRLLSDLYGRRAFPFQTLNFPVGTQQHFHSDSVQFSSVPERFMCGVWVALEDMDVDNGPLVYYPGSHNLPIFTSEHIGVNPPADDRQSEQYAFYERAWEALVDAHNLKAAYFYAKKGQALIWAANLLHGGAAQRDKNRTRYSQLTHYYFDDCSYYTALSSTPFLGPVTFHEIVDVSTGRVTPHLINQVEVPNDHIAYTSPTNHVTRPTRTPPEFDGDLYLKANADVAAAEVDPAKHWLEFGYRERRPLR